MSPCAYWQEGSDGEFSRCPKEGRQVVKIGGGVGEAPSGYLYFCVEHAAEMVTRIAEHRAKTA